MARKAPGASPKRRKSREPGALPQAVSSFSTGDAGGRYQDRVDGWLLAQLMMRQSLPDVPGTIVRAAFQRRVHGAVLDDSVMTTDADIEVQLSIKIGAVVAENDADFRDTIMLARTAQAHGRWAGIVAPPDASGMRALRRLVFLARANDPVAEFITASTTPGFIADRGRFDAVRKILDVAAGAQITDADFHGFLRKFVVLQLDFDIPQHRDEAAVVASLESIRGITRDQANTLYSKLVEIGEELAIAAASVDYPGLERQLRERNVVAGLPPDLRPLRASLISYAKRTFESNDDRVANVHLDRHQIVDDVEVALGDGHDVIVTGAAGFGKSTAIRAAVTRLESAGPVLSLSGRRIENAGSWPQLAAEIGLPPDRAQLVNLLATHPRGATVILDAVEHVVSPGARAAVNDLLHDIASAGFGLNVVLGVRDSALAAIGWLDTAALRPIREVTVGALTTREAAEIAAASPVLGELIARSPKPFPGGLKLLAMLHDSRISNAALANTPATESDLLDLWWRTVLVGDTDAGHDRFRIVLAAAEAVISQPSGFLELPLEAPGAVIAGLIRDGILLHDVALDYYRFGHDIIQDWAIVHWLSHRSSETVERLRLTLAAPGYYRAVALLAQRLAERDPVRYAEMRAAVADFEDRRGANAFLSALVLSPHARRLLEAHVDELLANDGAELTALLHIVESGQINISVARIDHLRRDVSTVAEATAIAAVLAAPRWRVWGPLIGFCLTNIDAIGAAYYPLLKVAARWQRLTPPAAVHRRAIMDVAIRVLTFFEGWRPHVAGQIGPKIAYTNSRDAEKIARSIVAHSTDVDVEYVKAYLHDLVEIGYGDDQEDMLGNLPAVSNALTEEIVDFGASVLIEPDARPGEVDLAYVGVRDHLYFPASDIQGPFLGILRTNEAAGLGLARALAGRAVAKYGSRIPRAQFRELTFSFGGRIFTFVGDGRAYAWFRPGSHDSDALTSALMAVDTWAFEAIKSGRDPVEVVELLLADFAPLPFLGIIVGLAYDVPAIVPALADLFAQPWFWRLEDYRVRLDAMPTDFNDLLPLEEQLPEYKPHLLARNRARDAEREEGRYPLRFAVDLLFRPESELHRAAFIAASRAKVMIDATLYQEEAAFVAHDPAADVVEDARAVFATFSRVTDPDCYDRHEDGSVQLRVTPVDREAIIAASVAQAVASARDANLRGSKLLRDYTVPDHPDAFDRVGEQFEQLSEWGQDVGDDSRDALRTGALRCACVAATFMPYAGTAASAWATGRVLDAGRAYDAEGWREGDEDVDVTDMRVSVATGLGALFAASPDDEEARGLVLRLATRIELVEVARGLMRGVLPLWERRPSAAQAVLSLLIETMLRADGEHPVDDATIEAVNAAERARTMRGWPAIVQLSRSAVYRIGKVLGGGLPRRITDDRAIAVFVTLIEALLNAAEAGDEEGLWAPFRGAVARLAVNAVVGITGGYDELRAGPADWTRSPEIFSETVAQVVAGHFNKIERDQAAARFSELADPFLRADHSAAIAHNPLDREFRDICWALIMVQNFAGVIVPSDAPSIARFEEHIGRWIAAVGGHPTNAEAVLVFLDRFVATFSATRIVEWIRTLISVTPAMHRATLWLERGWQISVLLLHLVKEHPLEMSANKTHREAAAIAEQLLAEGVPGAGELRDALEHVHRS